MDRIVQNLIRFVKRLFTVVMRPNKIIACHLKDFYSKEKNMLDHENQSAIGDGFIDWNDLISSVKNTNCELYILEHDDPKDYKEYILRSLENLKDI